ncbi:MAG: gliding motility-associated C-terminal domain-containing protein [Saprospiraceae bacterium]
MSKSILSLIVALFTAFQMRAAQPIFNISSLADVSHGQIVDIDFHVDHFSQIISVQYSVNWNPNVLKFKSVKNFNPMVPGLSPSVFGTNQALLDAGKLTLSWLESSATQITIPDGSLFFTVEFEVVGNACQSSAVAITNDPLEIEISEDGVNNVGLVTHNGQVSVFGEGCTQDLTIIGNSVVGTCGNTTCIQFTVDNFITVGAMEFSLVYDPTVIQFNHFQNFAPLPAFGEGNTNLLSPGTLRVVWFNGNAVNDSLPNGTSLFEICFDVIGSGGQSSNITLGTNPSVMISDIDGNLHNVVIQPAVVNVQCAFQGFGLLADTVCTTPNGITCIDITAHDFNDIVELQFSMNWDSTKFRFDHLEGFGIPDLNDSGFGTPPNPGVKQGQLTASWIDLTLQGVTVPDFTTIFRLCLKAIGPIGSSSPITFTNNPLEIEFADVDSLLHYSFQAGLAQIKMSCTPIDTPCTISYTINTSSPNCPRESNGSVDLNVTLTNCTQTPTYLWSPGNIPTQDLIGVPAGTYTVTITVGSQVVIATAIVTDPDPISVTGTITDPNPPGTSTGSIILNVSGGMTPYTYHWSNGALTKDLINIPAGTYSVTVTDSKGCSFIPDDYILGADFSASITNVTCNGGSNGSINLNVTYGTPPYTFKWNSGNATTPNLTNIKAGIYCVTITDSAGSTRDSCFTVTQTPALIVTATITNDLNVNCHGAIDLNVTGCTPPYTYIWSNGFNGQDLINLCQGQYCVTITCNGSGCSFDTCFNVSSTGFAVTLNALHHGNFEISCNGDCDGDINSTVVGGTAPFTYHWNNGMSTAHVGGSTICAGDYSLTVTDATGQTATSSITLNQPDAIVVTVTKTLPSDLTSSDGAISVAVAGGVPGYNYSWSPSAGNTAVLSNLSSGRYFLTVTDASGCEEILSVDLFINNECFKGISIITPNSDGKNDYFVISCISNLDNHLSIYNRFGGLVYETDNYLNNWDGVDGDDQPIADGGYLWVLEVRSGSSPIQIYKGTVNVLRTAD